MDIITGITEILQEIVHYLSFRDLYDMRCTSRHMYMTMRTVWMPSFFHHPRRDEVRRQYGFLAKIRHVYFQMPIESWKGKLYSDCVSLDLSTVAGTFRHTDHCRLFRSPHQLMDTFKKYGQDRIGFPLVGGTHSSMLFDTGIIIHHKEKEFTKNQIVDCLDEEGIWYSAIVRDRTATHYLISYLHWNPMWDRWIEYGSPSIQPANTFILPFTLKDLEITGKCDVRGIGELEHKWYRATVKNIDNGTVVLEYNRNYNRKDTVSRPWGSTTIAPLGIHSFPQDYRVQNRLRPGNQNGNVLGNYYFDAQRRSWKLRFQYADDDHQSSSIKNK